jgi:hypothetical protein
MKKLLLIIATITIILVIAYYDQILRLLVFVAYIFIFMIIVLFITLIILGYIFISERLKLIRAERLEAEKNANVMVITNGPQTYIRDTDRKAEWRTAHLEQRLYANGHYTEATVQEQLTWAAFTAPRSVSQGLLAPPEPTPPTVELLPALDGVKQCLILGVMDAGKTTLLQALMARRQTTNEVIVIDPHSAPGKWVGCTVIGAERDYNEIEKALRNLQELLDLRYREIGQGLVAEGQHPPVTVLIDEWRAIVRHTEKAASETIRALLTESRKATISCFVATHSDRAKPLGLEGEYDLADGFAFVRLSIVQGERKATIDFGEGPMPATLPVLPPPNGNQAEPVIIDAGPNELEQVILDMFADGDSVSAIAKEVYGSKGGNQNRQVKEILARFKDLINETK